MSLVHPAGSLPAQVVTAFSSWMSEQGDNPLDGHDVRGLLLWLANKLRPAAKTVGDSLLASLLKSKRRTGLKSEQKHQTTQAMAEVLHTWIEDASLPSLALQRRLQACAFWRRNKVRSGHYLDCTSDEEEGEVDKEEPDATLSATVSNQKDIDEDAVAVSSFSSSTSSSSTSSSSSSSTNSKKRKRQEYIVPGLTKSMFYSVSRYGSSTPAIQCFSRDEAGCIDATWNVSGSTSSPYVVTVKGKVNVSFQKTNYRGKLGVDPVYAGLAVCCSCPSGVEQESHNNMPMRSCLNVCKHANSVLQKMIDSQAVRYEDSMLKNEQAKFEVAAAKISRLQEDTMPGERARIEHGLKSQSSEKIVAFIKEKLDSIDGLQKVAALFDTNMMPTPQIQRCLRCKKDFDPQFSDGQSCKIDHKSEVTRWRGSKVSWSECDPEDGGCGKTWNLYGEARKYVWDEGEYCFKGRHTTDPGFDGTEGSGDDE